MMEALSSPKSADYSLARRFFLLVSIFTFFLSVVSLYKEKAVLANVQGTLDYHNVEETAQAQTMLSSNHTIIVQRKFPRDRPRGMGPTVPPNLTRYGQSGFGNLIVVPEYKLLFCYVEKTGCFFFI